MKTLLQNYLNHIVFVVDASGSMSGISKDVTTIFDNEIQHLAQRSKELDQETRVSVYLFNGKTNCLVYDIDVMRTPSLEKHYHASGGTALIDAATLAINDLGKTSTLYGDHSFLIYVLTDGEENQSNPGNKVNFPRVLSSLPENWTFAALVPDQRGVHEAKKHGFPVDNIAVWSTTSKGVVEVGKFIRETTDTYMVNRTKGIRGTKSLFKKLDANFSRSEVQNTLQELDRNKYKLYTVDYDIPIRECVEKQIGITYQPGMAYYQVTKTEEVQPYKLVCVEDRLNGKVYTGAQARNMLGLPNTTCKVKPGDFNNWNIYIQSTSVNRKCIANTKLLVLV